MNSEEVIQNSKRLNSKENCNPAVQDFHITVLADIIDKLDTLNKKFDKYEDIPLENGDNNDIEISMDRKVFHQSMYDSSKVTKQLKEDFDDHIRHTIGKGLTNLGLFTKNILQPIAWLVFVAFMIYSFLTNRADFNRSDKLQKTIEQTEKSNH
jgi:hypothetical protein